MDELKQLGEKARKLAGEAAAAEQMQRAMETDRIVRELQSRENENKWLRAAQSWTAVVASSTAALAVFLSMTALGFQFYQFRQGIAEQEKASETSQWRDALKNMSLRDDSAVLSSAIQMGSFFDSRYSQQSRSVAAMVLPCVTSGAGFDAVASEMRKHSTNENQKDLVSIAQAVVAEDWDIYSRAKSRRAMRPFADFLEDPTGMIAEGEQFTSNDREPQISGQTECERDGRLNPLKRALICSYNEDTISKLLARLWRDNPLWDPGPAHLGLTGIVLENADLTEVDFSGATLDKVEINSCKLARTDFTKAILRGVVFANITSFAGSKWQGAEWWNAAAISCDLAKYLNSRFPPPQEFTAAANELVRKGCDGSKNNSDK
jgi:Pentapeptide repeats (8 copies)